MRFRNPIGGKGPVLAERSASALSGAYIHGAVQRGGWRGPCVTVSRATFQLFNTGRILSIRASPEAERPFLFLLGLFKARCGLTTAYGLALRAELRLLALSPLMLDLCPRRTRVAALASKFVAVLIESPRSVNSCLRTIRAAIRELILPLCQGSGIWQFSDSLRKQT